MAKTTSRGTADILFPAAGLVKRYGYQNQPSYTCVEAMNVRPFDPIKGRERGGSRPGLVKSFALQLGAGQNTGSPVQMLCPLAVVGADAEVSYRMAAISNGQLYCTTDAGTIEAVTGTHASLMNSSAATLSATQNGTKLYIAEHRSIPLGGTDGHLSADGILTADSITDWTAQGLNRWLDVVLISGDSVSDANTDYYSITADPSVSGIQTGWTGGAVASVTWQFTRPPKVFDPIAGTVWSLPQTYGLVPLGCTLTCTYRGRLVLAGPDHIWYMSYVDDPTNWDYGEDDRDSMRAVAGSGSDAGDIGNPIRALVPFSDDFMLFGCENALWCLRGDPANSGTIDNLSREIGIIGANSWCLLPDSNLCFLSRQGLFTVSSNSDDPYPKSLSNTAIPSDLIDVDPEANTISMAYDGQYRGIHLYITPVDGSAGQHWWIDWEEKGFWPVSLPLAQQPTVARSVSLGPDTPRAVFLGGVDGFVRNYDPDAKDDCGTAISSRVRFGPLRLSTESGTDGVLAEIQVDLAEDSGDVDLEIHSSDTAEAASLSTSPAATGTLVAGRNAPSHPRVRGVAGSIVFKSEDQWAMERMAVTMFRGGKPR
jgi:hypothetical protein